MKYAALPAIAALLVSFGCATDVVVAPSADRTFPLKATVTETSVCSVDVKGTSYRSTGRIRGDVPDKFIGTVKNDSYHGFGCAMAVGDGNGILDAELIVVFSGNRFGQPLAVGTYQLVSEILDGTAPMRANVTFRAANIEAEKLSTFDGGRGTVTVESTPSGGRRVIVDADVFLYNRPNL